MIDILIHMKIHIMVQSKLCSNMLIMTDIMIIMTAKQYDHVMMITAEIV